MTPPNDPTYTPSGYGERDEWMECPRCRSVMLPLREFEIQSASDFPAIEAEWWEFLIWGWMAFVYNFAFGLLTYGARKGKIAALKRDTLPRFPNTLICPRCLSVVRRP